MDESGVMRYRYISERESYYSSLSSEMNHIIEEDGMNLKIILSENDRILTSFYNPLKNYSLSWSWFILEQLGIWELYIDMLSRQNRYFIKPLTATIKLHFTSDDGGEIYNTIYLYPWQYIVFDPTRNSFYANADLARMQILTDIWYIRDFANIPERLEIYIWQESIYQSYREKIIEKQTYFRQKLNEFSQLKVSNLTSVSRAERYFLIFLNPEKKRIYYQNRIVELYIDIIESKSINKIKISEISRYLGLLRELNPQAYEQSRNTLASFNSLMFRNQNSQNVASNVSLALLEDEWQKSHEYLFFIFYNFIISHSTHLTRGEEILIKNYIESFLSFFQENTSAMQYFSYLLQEKTLELLTGPKNIDHSYMLLYLWEYIRVSQMSFASNPLEKKSLLYIYQNLIELLEVYLSNTFFQNDRTNTNLLILKWDVNLNSQDLVILRQHIFSLLTYYTTNSSLLDETILQDSFLRISLFEKSILLREYITALKNYESYTLEFDKVSQALLERGKGSTLSDMISNTSVLQYLWRFQWLWLSNVRININEDSQVQIEWISISWRSLGFTLLPLGWNRVRDIVLDGMSLKFEYPLDAIESDWEEKMSTTSDDDKERFDFRRFFLMTLIEDRRDIWRDIITENIPFQEEDRVVAVFKREGLLGNDGQFSTLDDIMMFRYNDIKVTRIHDTFDIFLESVWLRLQARENRNNRVFDGFFSSEYILTDDSGRFKDMKIQIYEDKERSERTVFWRNYLHIVGEIPLNEIRSVLEGLSDIFLDILSIINILNQSGISWEISFQYFPDDQKLRIRFDFWGERHTIVYASSKIESYIRGRQRVITEPISVSNLTEYLK